jgi:transposase-like protein
MKRQRYKCKWCDFTVANNGKHGWDELKQHCYNAHPNEYEALQEKLGPVDYETED